MRSGISRTEEAPTTTMGPDKRGPSSYMRWRGLEPPRGCPHKALNLARLPIPPPARGAIVPGLREQPVQDHGVQEEEHGHDRRQAREVALDDVGASLRLRREAHTTEARLAAGVHQHEDDEPAEIRTCRTAKNGTIAAGWYQR